MSYQDKIKSLNEALKRRLELKALGQSLVMTNGCFDLLHPGHLRYLEEARNLGDCLMVAINDDDSVRRLKGPERPIRALSERSEMLAGLAMVDLVVAFPEDEPKAIIEFIKPDILVKGGDWAVKDIVGAKETLALGGRVYSLSLSKGFSTTSLIDKIKAMAVPR
jgi:D-beta-D-heptose 7-phosphate kinase/D-beta-D-heptose 1-phosphate adenosyltransferase